MINIKKIYLVLVAFGLTLLSGCQQNNNQIKIPDDAPKFWTPEEAVKSFKLSPGFKIELVASEPLISDPTSLCWDAKGDLYVGEHHGYNLPGQLEIEEMNKSGVLDTVVQRVKAQDKYYEQAKKDTFGRIKKLKDTNGDGVMDMSEIFADNLPPVYGLTAARDGLVVACQDQVIYVADKDGDGVAEVIETLFKGWEEYELERGLSMPLWENGWVYFGSGVGSVNVTGPYLQNPVRIPNTNFRIRADGSQIEPVTGKVGTIGIALNSDGYVLTSHSVYSIPIDWKYVVRNPDFTISQLTAKSTDNEIVYPLAPVHPWRLTRSEGDWGGYYSDRYGTKEATASGFFTGECCPMVYREDTLFPKEFVGNLFVSESAEKLVHRLIVEKDGTGLKATKPKSEEKSEFLASVDTWFSPVGLSQGPDGSIYLVDFYREIIEDYSAVPRPMQQLYQLNHGIDKGRIYRISPEKAPALKFVNIVNLEDLTDADLEKELDSPHYWRRNTANRLIFERQGEQSPILSNRRLKLSDIEISMPERDFINTLKAFDKDLATDVNTARKLAQYSTRITNERILLQLALSLGYSQDAQVFETLTALARNKGDIRWMQEAILTGVQNRELQLANNLLGNPGKTGHSFLEPLSAIVASKNNIGELASLLESVYKSKNTRLQLASLQGISGSIGDATINNETKATIEKLLTSPSDSVRYNCAIIALKLKMSDSKELNKILTKVKENVIDGNLSTDERLKAISLISNSNLKDGNDLLIKAWSNSNIPIRTGIFDVMTSNKDKYNVIYDALVDGKIPVEALSQSQRKKLLKGGDSGQQRELEDLFSKSPISDRNILYANYMKSIRGGVPDTDNGKLIFEKQCSICHQVGGRFGTSVGPDLSRAFSASDESLLQSIIWPNDKITSGYETYNITTKQDESFSGVLASETGNTIILRNAGGLERVFQKSDLANLTRSESSIMPGFEGALTPQEMIDVIRWFKSSLKDN